MNTNIYAMCLKSPTDALTIVKSMKQEIIRADFDTLLSTATNHPLAKYVASVAKGASYGNWLWILAFQEHVASNHC